jgi:hypothetical protein
VREGPGASELLPGGQISMPMCIYCDGYVPHEIATDPQGQCPTCGGSDFLDVEETDEETTG